MADEERVAGFIRSMEAPLSGFLEKVEESAISEEVPVIRPEMRSFLQIFLELKKPSRILEIGTATGFSAMFMAEHTDPGCLIVTIENYEKRIEKAKQNFAASGYADRITLLEGDAQDILPQLGGPFDIVFVDAAKAQYINYLPEVLRLLGEGGVLISDNVLQEGDILQSHYAVARRNRTIHKRMREYLYEIKHHSQLITSIVPVGDGAAVSVKISGSRENGS